MPESAQKSIANSLADKENSNQENKSSQGTPISLQSTLGKSIPIQNTPDSKSILNQITPGNTTPNQTTLGKSIPNLATPDDKSLKTPNQNLQETPSTTACSTPTQETTPSSTSKPKQSRAAALLERVRGSFDSFVRSEPVKK